MSATNGKRPFSMVRNHERLQIVQEISLNYEGHSETIEVRPADISASGIFVNTGRFFPAGAVVTVRCKLSHSASEICARGEVRYCLRGVGVGVEFTDISAEAIRVIENEPRITNKPRVERIGSDGGRSPEGKKNGRRVRRFRK